MRLDELAAVLREFEEKLVRVGVSADMARKAAIDAEGVAVADLLQTHNDLRLLDLFEEVGCAVLAEREGVARNTIYNRRTEALNRLADKQVSRRVEQTVAQEAA